MGSGLGASLSVWVRSHLLTGGPGHISEPLKAAVGTVLVKLYPAPCWLRWDDFFRVIETKGSQQWTGPFMPQDVRVGDRWGAVPQGTGGAR